MKLVACLVHITALVFAGDYGSITGQLSYENKTPVVGADITVDMARIGTTSDESGKFLIPFIPVGRCTLMIEHSDWMLPMHIDVTVRRNSTTHIRCSVSDVCDSALSFQTRQFFRSDDVARTITITSSDIARLPVADLNELLILQPGITESEDGLHARGGQANAMVYYLDGVITSVPVSLAAIDEVLVDENMLDPGHGFESSGVVRIATKRTPGAFRSSVHVFTDALFSDGLKYGYNRCEIVADGSSGALEYLAAGNYASSDALQPALYRIDSPGNDYSIFGRLSASFLHGRGETSISGAQARQQYIPWNINTEPGNYLKYFDNKPMLRAKKSLIAVSLKFDITRTTRVAVQAARNDNDLCFGTRDYAWESAHDARWFDDYRLKAEHLIPLLLEAEIPPPEVIDSISKCHEEWNNRDAEGLRSNPFSTEGIFYTIGDYRYWQYSRADDQQVHLELHQFVGNTQHFTAGLRYRGYDIIKFSSSLAWGDAPFWDYYCRKPYTIAAYFQDRMRLGRLRALIGVRYEYFDANAFTYAEPQDFTNDTLVYSTALAAIMPRVGLRIFVTDNMDLHFNIGTHFNIPQFDYFYSNTDTSVVRRYLGYGGTVLGNINLESENMFSCEFGMSSVILDDITLEFTGFYRKTKGLINIETVYALPVPYFQHFNSDNESVKGFEFSVDVPVTRYFRVGANYVLQYALATGWLEAWDHYFYDTLNGSHYHWLAHDQRHAMRIRLGAVIPDDHELVPLQDMESAIFISYHSGQRYTPEDLYGHQTGDLSSERMPDYFNVDWKLSKGIRAGPVKFVITGLINNLSNEKQVVDLYNSTGYPDDHGDPEPSLGQFWYIPMTSRRYSPQGDRNHDGLISPVEAKEDYLAAIAELYDDPTNWRHPFRVRLGIGMVF